MARMFGTDGVRGVAGTELTIELAMKLGQAGAYVLTKEQSHQPTIIIGCDTRISGGMLANALMAGICSVGANAIFVGVAPTPAIAYLTRKHKVDAGVVISASHNPMEFNDSQFFPHRIQSAVQHLSYYCGSALRFHPPTHQKAYIRLH